MKIECECGKLITDGTDFLRYKGYILADQDHDHFYDAIDEAIEKSGPSAADKENACMDVRCLSVFRMMYQCTECGSIYINDWSGNLHQFSPKSKSCPKTLLQSKRSAQQSPPSL